MAYVLVVGGVVVQKQCTSEVGFIEVEDTVCCGMVYTDGIFSIPPPTKTAGGVRGDCEKYLLSKLSVGFVYSGSTYQIDADSQSGIEKRAIYAGWSVADALSFPWGDPYNLGWWDVTNAWHAMTAAEFMLFAKAVSDYVSACTACCRDHKNAITPENCATYDYTTGWPVNP